MTSTADLVKLPIADRLALIDELWASISEQEVVLEPGQVNEARARWAELKANPAQGISYDELKSRLG
jgi:putative addiction module component (TIGR02574 family)